MSGSLIAAHHQAETLFESREHGTKLTAASKDSIIDRMKPSVRKRRSLLIEQIDTMLEQQITRAVSRKGQKMARPGMGIMEREEYRNKLHRERLNNLFSAEALHGKVKGFRTDTLELMVSKARSGEGDLLWACDPKVSETMIRSLLTYGHLTGGSYPVLESLLRDVREADLRFALEDTSLLTGRDRKDAELIIMLGCRIRKVIREMDVLCRSPRIRGKGYRDGDHRFHVSPALAALVMERDDCIEAIGDYITTADNGVPVTEAEVGHFREYLDTPSKALGAGIL